MKNYKIDKNGYYGNFGGAIVPNALKKNIDDLRKAFEKISKTPSFKNEFAKLLKDYVGRPSPLYLSEKLSKKYGAKIYFKREDLNHTGSHKINNTLGQILLAKKMGKKRVIAETGAGSHGVATATVCALMDIECKVFMGKVDIERQQPNVKRMKMLGAEVVSVKSGGGTLKDAVDEALGYWVENASDTFYLLGSAVGPHPYPMMVTAFQSVISKEIKMQLKKSEGRNSPDYVVACIGGGSNAAGAFYHFIKDKSVKLVAAEAGGLGAFSGKTAATLTIGKPCTLHGMQTLAMQDECGEVAEPYSISAGLDYPGIGPMHAYLYTQKRLIAHAITDEEALKAAFLLTKSDGIIPALESAHAIAALEKLRFKKGDIVVVNLSGRGDKDMEAYLDYFDSLQKK